LTYLDMSQTDLSVNAILQICDVVASLDREMSLDLGRWDVSNSAANQAVCDLIRTGGALEQLSLGHFSKPLSGFPVDMLAVALSSSLCLRKMTIQCHTLSEALMNVTQLTYRIAFPNRLEHVDYRFSDGSRVDALYKARLSRAQETVNARLRRMQSKQVFVLLAMAYAVTAMKKCGGLVKHENDLLVTCPLTTLNVVLLKHVASFLFK
jgi:hypothetical protein